MPALGVGWPDNFENWHGQSTREFAGEEDLSLVGIPHAIPTQDRHT